jgi:hypothetical protein
LLHACTTCNQSVSISREIVCDEHKWKNKIGERKRVKRERDPSFNGSASMSETLIDFNVATTKRKGIVSEIS